MSLSNDLVSQFVKITKDSTTVSGGTTHYGTIVEYNESLYVKIDGSDQLTPYETTANVSNGDRVVVKIENHTATVMGSTSSPSASSTEVKELGTKISEFEIIVADKVTTEELEATNARIDTLVSENVTIKDTLTANKAVISELEAENVTITEKLTANEAEIKSLKADKLDAEIADITYATITDLEATNAKINNLEATYGDFEVLTTKKFEAIDATIGDLDATYATIAMLEATDAKINNLEADIAKIDSLEADVADIETLIFGSASGNVIQTDFSNAVVAQIGDAQIKSAMIESVTASKITAGDIITNNVRVMSEDGSLVISDETIQISDDTRVRVQIGKDAANDYSINIWDANGNLMFSEGGITDSAIKEAIIRNDMVSETANISAGKLDIDSLFEEINGSSNTIKSTKIYLNDEEQTLDVAFKSMTTTTDELSETVSSQGTQIGVIQGQISSKIWQEDIDAAVGSGEEIETLRTQYSELAQEIDSISATVASHTTELEGKADDADVTAVHDQVSTLELDLTGFKTLVSDTYATKDDVNSVADRVTITESSIEQNTAQIALRVTQEELIEATDEVREEISEKSASIITDCEGVILTALESYVDTTNYNEFKETVESELTLLTDEMTLKFTETKQQLEDTNASLQDQINTITKYFTFDINGMTIGEVDNPNKVVIDNDNISILVNDTVVQQFDANGSALIPELDITESFRLLGFLVDKDDDGGVSCEYVGTTLRITKHPTDQTVIVGETATFTLQAVGEGQLTYDWRYKSPTASAWSKMTTFNLNTATRTPTGTSYDGYLIRCTVSDFHGNQVVSKTATMHVVETETETEV